MGALFLGETAGQLEDGGTALSMAFGPYVRLCRYLSLGIDAGGTYAKYTTDTIPPLDSDVGTYGNRMDLKLIHLAGTARGHLPLGRFEPFLEFGAGVSFGTLSAPVETQVDPGAAFTGIEHQATAASARLLFGFDIVWTETVRSSAAGFRAWARPMDFAELSGGQVTLGGYGFLVGIDLYFDLPQPASSHSPATRGRVPR